MTLLGMGMIAASVYVYVKVPNSEVFALALLGAGGLAFGLKDPKLPGSGGAAPTAVMILLGLLMLSSCATYNRCLRKFAVGKDTVEIPITVHLKDTVRIITVS